MAKPRRKDGLLVPWDEAGLTAQERQKRIREAVDLAMSQPLELPPEFEAIIERRRKRLPLH